jgi:hypothetical protein
MVIIFIAKLARNVHYCRQLLIQLSMMVPYLDGKSPHKPPNDAKEMVPIVQPNR